MEFFSDVVELLICYLRHLTQPVSDFVVFIKPICDNRRLRGFLGPPILDIRLTLPRLKTFPTLTGKLKTPNFLIGVFFSSQISGRAVCDFH